MTGLSEKLRKQGSGMMERYAEEYRRAPVNDLAAAIAMSVEAVLKCTGISKGLKGSIAKQIREETCRAAACATLLSLQAQKPPEEREADEMAALRRELEAARKESGQLREENRALRDRAAELPSLERRQAAARGPGGSGAGTSGPAPAGAAAPGPPAVGPAGAGGAASGAGPAPVPPGGGGATRSYASVASAAPSGARGGAARRGKDKGKGKGGAAGDGRGAPVPSAPPAAAADVTVRRASGGKARRTPATRAVAVTCEDGAYAETLREARSKIDLASLGVSEVRPRRAQTGALLLEVPNRDGQDGADRLAEKLRQVLEGKKGVRVTQPVKMAELRLGGLEESVTPDEISRALADKGGCPVGDIKLGEPRRAPGGLFTVWARCPLAAANRIAAVDGGRLVVGGWFRVRAELLGVRPLQCFRCLQRGHVRSVCGSKEDRSDTCYRCGGAGHRAAGCTAPVKCPVCARAGRPCGHRVGGPQCGAPVVRGGLPPAREARSGAAAPGNAGSGGPPSGGSSPVLGGAAAAVAAAATEGPMEVDPLPEGGGGPPLPQRESRDDPKGAEDASLSVHNAP
ncbi:spidroin-2-like [Monomorium pharaonis]|uniref:spidroin-2-like n=1 Tax=Monomorium pharaonis TaxID=307658 RepID=UPI0017476698|nr:spidroin-2-like [Monomorium pharaonis]